MREIDRKLFKSAAKGDVDELAALLKNGASAKAADDMGVTPLMVAALKDHVDCVRTLLPSSDAKAVDAEGASAFVYACQHMRLDCAKALAAASDMERKDADGLTAMDHARGWGDAELISFLDSYRLAKREAREVAEAASSGGQSVSCSRL